MVSNSILFLQRNIILSLFLLGINGCSTLNVKTDSSTHTTSMIKLGSSDIAIAIAGKNTSTVVFESGLGVDKNTWDGVFKILAKKNKVFAYDRAGLGESPSSNTPRDSCTIARELHETLAASNTKPPYVLVGHSIGGLYQYVFGTLYPEDVAGLVLVDSHLPEPWIHQAKIPLPKEHLYLKNKPNYFMRLQKKLVEKYTVGGKEDANKYYCLENIDITKPVKFPVRIIQAFDNKNTPPPLLAWHKKRGKWYFQEWFHILGKKVPIREVNSGHYIQEDRPEVVTDEIQKLLTTIRNKKTYK